MRFCCISWCKCSTTPAFQSSLWVFCPPVSLRDDVYGPLGGQERTGGGIGLREADGGLLERSPHTQPPAQCCWCLEPGTVVCVRTARCGDTHLFQGTEVFFWRTEGSLCLSPPLLSPPFFIFVPLYPSITLFLFR